MTDAITAITSSTTPPTYEQISPNELADFENAYEGEEIQFSSIKSIDKTQPIDLSDRLLQHIVDIDEEYHHLFANKTKGVSKTNFSSESNALQPENIKLDSSELGNIDFVPTSSTINYQRVLDSMERLQIKGQEVSAWSTKLQIVTSTAAMMMKSVGSMLRG